MNPASASDELIKRASMHALKAHACTQRRGTSNQTSMVDPIYWSWMMSTVVLATVFHDESVKVFCLAVAWQNRTAPEVGMDKLLAFLVFVSCKTGAHVSE